MLKHLSLLILVSVTIISCKNDKPKFADLYIIFDYNGNKIDTTTSNRDQLIFRNVDETNPVYVPNYFPEGCTNKVKIGMYALGDTISFHIRLVEPDSEPELFQFYFNEDGEPITLTESLHFLQPTLWNFEVRREFCDDQMIVVIGN